MPHAPWWDHPGLYLRVLTPRVHRALSALRTFLLRALPLRALSEVRVATGAPALLFGILSLRAALSPVTDPDVWWLATVGRDLLASHRFPTENTYSFADPHHPWVLHEGLASVLYALGLTHLGTAFVPLFGLTSAALTVALVLRATLGRCAHPAAGAGLALLALVGVRECFFSPRPGYVSFALVLTMAAIAWAPRWSLALTVAALFVQVLWTNFHGSFPLGVLLLAAGAVSKGGRSRWATVLAAASVTFINPYGWHLHTLIARYLFGSDLAITLVHRSIAEFSPIFRPVAPFASAYSILAASAVFAFALSALAHRRHRARAAVVFITLALGVLHVRHLALAILTGCALLGPELDDLLASTELSTIDPLHRPRARTVVLPGYVLGLVGIGLVVLGNHPHDVRVDDSLGGSSLPRLTRLLPPGASVYAPFDASGRLLWVTGGNVRVLLDPRNDCYGAPVLTVGYAIETGAVPVRTLGGTLARAGAVWALVPDGRPVGVALARDPGWRLVARDGAWTLRRRVSFRASGRSIPSPG